MRERERKIVNGRNYPVDELDWELDAALSKYIAVEPRAGLEERILANLRAEQSNLVAPRVWGRACWHWGLAGAVAVVVVVALALAWRTGKPARRVVAKHTSAPVHATGETPAQVASNTGSSGVPTSTGKSLRRITARGSHVPGSVPAPPKLDPPKLDQFPSPQPPSPEELALRKYVSRFPQEATLIARTQEEFEKEIQQMMKDQHSDTEYSNSYQQER
jgi:hypothetical protein